ncbi:hypothetical protein APUTEX25_002668 [Auxenochlorella protothecoides]|uniref:non-specific serine/threonine protein kinase n=1 Tax=Auxenochlorella protothecoides TaxID=3075 RepID=A0A3M7KU74_AUXPR|nr:hypothetical protein APUTEX25_002668 [Auxenochlorella protothecoides]|eukprot:RMZ54091.1 hypothetical protein APUTEX25_002668 [Auxenochlorella protothecoides]
MDGFLKSVGGAWSSLTEKYPQLTQLEERVVTLLPRLSPEHVIQLGPKRYRVIRTLGEGGYSTVYLVRELSERTGDLGTAPAEPPGPDLALKQIFLAGPEEEQRAAAEVRLLQSLAHPNIIRLLESTVTDVDTPSGPRRAALLLFPAYQARRPGWGWAPPPLRTVLSIFIQLCAALEAVHAAGLSHRDVKPQNLLMEARPGATPRTVLMDLGSAGPAAVPAHCTAPYRAPELWEVVPGTVLTEKVDVWAAGCVLYCLAYRESPFERATGTTGGSLKLAILNGGCTFPEEPKHLACLQPLIRACLEQDPSRRPSAAEAKLMAQTLLEEAVRDPVGGLEGAGGPLAHLTARASPVAGLEGTGVAGPGAL